MSCCGGRKNRVKPTGGNVKNTDPKGDKTADRAMSTRLGRRRSQTFAVKTRTGKVLTFESKLEALAEQARNGGTIKF